MFTPGGTPGGARGGEAVDSEEIRIPDKMVGMSEYKVWFQDVLVTLPSV